MGEWLNDIVYVDVTYPCLQFYHGLTLWRGSEIERSSKAHTDDLVVAKPPDQRLRHTKG